MTTVDTGRTPVSAIGAARDARTFGQHTFNPRSGSKIIGGALKKRIDAQRKGTPLNSLRGEQPSVAGPLGNLFRTKHTNPRYNDGLGDEPDFNMSLVINRSVKAVAPCFGALEMDQLGFLYKKNEFNLNTSRCEVSNFMLQCNPQDIIPPQVFNFALTQIQAEEARQFPELYRKRTPQDYYKDFIVDGVASHVTAMQNRASVFADCESGYFGTSIENPGACTTMVTMAAKAVIRVVNYWGPNVRPGAQLYFVIRKFDPSDYTNDYKQGKLTLTNYCAKQVTTTTNGATNDATTNPLTPYQLAFFSLPFGGPIPTEYTRYFDEEGNLRTDSVVVHLGTVTECPVGHHFRETNEKLKPFTGVLPNCPLSNFSSINDAMLNPGHMSQQTLKIILNPDDGLRTM